MAPRFLIPVSAASSVVTPTRVSTAASPARCGKVWQWCGAAGRGSPTPAGMDPRQREVQARHRPEKQRRRRVSQSVSRYPTK